MKMQMSLEEMCSELPLEFASYMHYIRTLRFDDKPDYNYLRNMFKELLIKENEEYDHVYDWLL